MQTKKLIIDYKKKKIKINSKNCKFWNKAVGLMFSSREKAGILLFDNLNKNENFIHSLFVFYSFLAIWLDKNNRVVDLMVVRPFSPHIAPKKRAHKLVEVPLNKKNKKITLFFIGK